MTFIFVLFMSPIITPGPPGSWEDRWVLDGHVLFINDTLKMWYLGVSNHSGFTYKGIGLAYSTDSGRTWHKYPGNPVFVADSSSFWERSGINPPRSGLWEAVVLYENNEYKMWYQSRDEIAFWNTLYATSKDGIKWTRRNDGKPVLYAGRHHGNIWYWDYYYAGVRSVVKVGSLYYLFYEGEGAVDPGNLKMGLAIGINETTFTKVNNFYPTFTPIGTADTLWIGKSIIPNVIMDDNTFILIYSSNSAHTGKTTVGLALSHDGINWVRYRGNPICNLTGMGIPGGAITALYWDIRGKLVKELIGVARSLPSGIYLCNLSFLLHKQ